MSNAIRQMKRRKGGTARKKPRGLSHTRPPRPGPSARVLGTPKDSDGKDLPPDLSLADPSCKYCYGTGVCGETKQLDGTPVYLLCTCVNRAMTDGTAPWLERRKRA